ncbi:MAG: hypothetical protein GTN71_14080 [Anaerolineae bacterium]|nr:hypothetical protein [Anaerolineae bacterium]
MLDQISAIVNFIVAAFLHIWPYLLVTIPLAVAVNLSGASRYINRAFQARPLVAIFLATAVGAFSPFCSCGVIPVIAALLMSGVPLAPVMSFWIASPSMDPEAFFLSVSTIGWELAVWRLVATLILSLSAGFVTHFIAERGWLGQQVLRRRQAISVQSTWTLLKRGWQRLERGLSSSPSLRLGAGNPVLAAEAVCCGTSAAVGASMGDNRRIAPATPASGYNTGCGAGCGDNCGSTEGSSCSGNTTSFRRRLLDETWNATLMVAKFMALAFFLEALITLYIPTEWIAGLLGRQNPWAIVTAAFLGVPVYTSNLAALPMVSGLLTQGMNPAAALAFLIAGPTTTLPAMSAVWGLTSRRVFALYVSFSLVGAVALGYLYSWVA